MSATEERWTPVTGYESVYEVSCFGRVKRLAGPHRLADRILAPRNKPAGYRFVTLSDLNHKKKSFYVHSLVAEGFIGPRQDKMDVNHINGIKSDNNVENLEYVTRSENMSHARRLGLHRNFADGHYGAKLTSESVREIRKSTARPTDLAAQFSVSERCILDVITNKTWRSVK